jgi:hypothetical protein
VSEGLLLDLEKLPLRQARDGFVKHYLERLYEEHLRNVSRAARASGISRESFHRLLKKLKLNGRSRSFRPKAEECPPGQDAAPSPPRSHQGRRG